MADLARQGSAKVCQLRRPAGKRGADHFLASRRGIGSGARLRCRDLPQDYYMMPFSLLRPAGRMAGELPIHSSSARPDGPDMPRLQINFDWPKVVLELRQRSRKSQAEFAVAVSCSLSTVSKWERGQTLPLPRQLRQVEEFGSALGFPPSDWPEASKQARLFGQ